METFGILFFIFYRLDLKIKKIQHSSKMDGFSVHIYF